MHFYYPSKILWHKLPMIICWQILFEENSGDLVISITHSSWFPTNINLLKAMTSMKEWLFRLIKVSILHRMNGPEQVNSFCKASIRGLIAPVCFSYFFSSSIKVMKGWPFPGLGQIKGKGGSKSKGENESSFFFANIQQTQLCSCFLYFKGKFSLISMWSLERLWVSFCGTEGKG